MALLIEQDDASPPAETKYSLMSIKIAQNREMAVKGIKITTPIENGRQVLQMEFLKTGAKVRYDPKSANNALECIAEYMLDWIEFTITLSVVADGDKEMDILKKTFTSPRATADKKKTFVYDHVNKFLVMTWVIENP